MLGSLLPVFAGAAMGGAGGGLLGQTTDALAAPRKALWRYLGLPEQGSEILSQYAGMNPEDWLTQGAGFGLEVLGDPMTYALGGLGGMAGMLDVAAARGGGGVVANQMVAHGLQNSIDDVARAGGLREIEYAQALAGTRPRMSDLSQIIDPATLGSTSKAYTSSYDPAAAQLMEQWGVGTLSPEGKYGTFTLNQGTMPETFAIGGDGLSGGNPWMRATGFHPDAAVPQFADDAEYWNLFNQANAKGGGVGHQIDRTAHLSAENFPSPAIGPNPEELAKIQGLVAQRGGGVPGFQAPPGFNRNVFGDLAHSQALSQVPEIPVEQSMGGLQSALLRRMAMMQEAEQARKAASASSPLFQAVNLGLGTATGGMLGANAMRPEGQRFF